MSELKPCPFCGSKPEQYDNEYACCTGSKCPMSNMVIDNRVWNTRAVLAQEAGPVVERQEPLVWVSHHLRGSLAGKWFIVEGPQAAPNRQLYAEPKALYTSPPAPAAVRITLQQVLKAYVYADSHPHKYLRGTTNWCAAVAHELNACLDKVKEMNR